SATEEASIDAEEIDSALSLRLGLCQGIRPRVESQLAGTASPAFMSATTHQWFSSLAASLVLPLETESPIVQPLYTWTSGLSPKIDLNSIRIIYLRKSRPSQFRTSKNYPSGLSIR